MKKITIALLSLFFPAFAIAQDSSLSFSPPPNDYSVIFLGNIFGVVDGVLHGTGTQIMGSMFAVLNAAVLALGGIVIMYTLLVSTLNTAQEGQFLGQKWSSLWVPVRTTLGLALLIPKASGYCLMQIFVMWVILQGVGAADKVWDAALGYLNRGGAIVMAQPNPAQKYLKDSTTQGVPLGAQTILAGQVCMVGLQKQLENQRNKYLQLKQKNTGPCNGDLSSQPDMKSFCGSNVPDFLNTVNIISAQSTQQSSITPDGYFSVNMPNFTEKPYSDLNGICGVLKWKPFTFSNPSEVNKLVSENDVDTAKMSRAIAIQQMYMNLSMVAQVMVNNDPGINPPQGDADDNSKYSSVAEQQFGVPQTVSGDVCQSSSTKNCKAWGQVPGSSSAPLLNGTEFQGAISDYNTIMLPTLTLQQQANDTSTEQDAREFIKDASTKGWIMAGSYFFNLVRLNVSAMNAATGQVDTNSGLDQSNFNLSGLTSWIKSCYDDKPPFLCQVFDNAQFKEQSKIQNISYLIGGNGDNIGQVNKTDFSGTISSAVSSYEDSTVYGFIRNSMVLQIDDKQPGLSGLTFGSLGNIPPPDVHQFDMGSPPTPCEGGRFFFFVCIGELIGTVVWIIFQFIYDFLFTLFAKMISDLLWGFLMAPLQGMADIFQHGVQMITQPGVNPIVALANMGTYYINFAGELWINLIIMSITAALIPVIGVFVFALIALSMPLLLAWTGIMVSIGFTTAYFVPVLPYLIFTFGSIAWLIAVIEAMVAAPIVALGVTHPEGHEAFGKGEAAIMILMNVFLRPSMMIIGYIAGIALSYVGVWILNAGFDNAIAFVEGKGAYAPGSSILAQIGFSAAAFGISGDNAIVTNVTGGYTGWAGVYAYFFSILIYTMMYLTIVQKAFTLIAVLPDKVLRWIGGTQEGVGQEAAQWGEEVKGKVGEAGKETQGAQAAMDKQLSGYGKKGIGKAKKAFGQSGGGQVKAQGKTPESSQGNVPS